MSDTQTDRPGHSTGPRSATGKKTSSGNSTKHGLCAKGKILPDETEADYDALRHGWTQQYPPVSFLIEQLLEEVVDDAWLLARARRRVHAAESAFAADASEANAKTLQLMHRYQTTAKRNFQRSWKALEQIQSARKRENIQDEKHEWFRERRDLEKLRLYARLVASEPSLAKSDQAPDAPEPQIDRTYARR